MLITLAAAASTDLATNKNGNEIGAGVSQQCGGYPRAHQWPIPVDIEIEKNKVRERCLELYPDREELYEMVYESRFQRLWDQFRDAGEEA